MRQKKETVVSHAIPGEHHPLRLIPEARTL